jgi:hypothetical protein
MPAATRATPGPHPPLAPQQPQMPPAPNTNVAPPAPANATNANNPVPGTGTSTFASLAINAFSLVPGTGTTTTQQINDTHHIIIAFPHGKAANGTIDTPTQDALRYVAHAKARYTGYKPDPATAKWATVMPWLHTGEPTGHWGLSARQFLIATGIPNSAAIGKTRAITWASAKNKVAALTDAADDGVLKWRTDDAAVDTEMADLQPLPWAIPAAPKGFPKPLTDKPLTKQDVTPDELLWLYTQRSSRSSALQAAERDVATAAAASGVGLPMELARPAAETQPAQLEQQADARRERDTAQACEVAWRSRVELAELVQRQGAPCSCAQCGSRSSARHCRRCLLAYACGLACAREHWLRLGRRAAGSASASAAGAGDGSGTGLSSQLTRGTVEAIMQGSTVARPVMHVVSVQPLSGAWFSINLLEQWFALWLSDGKEEAYALLWRSSNDLVLRGGLSEGCVVELIDYRLAELASEHRAVRGRKVVVLFDCKLLVKAADAQEPRPAVRFLDCLLREIESDSESEAALGPNDLVFAGARALAAASAEPADAFSGAGAWASRAGGAASSKGAVTVGVTASVSATTATANTATTATIATAAAVAAGPSVVTELARATRAATAEPGDADAVKLKGSNQTEGATGVVAREAPQAQVKAPQEKTQTQDMAVAVAPHANKGAADREAPQAQDMAVAPHANKGAADREAPQAQVKAPQEKQKTRTQAQTQQDMAEAPHAKKGAAEAAPPVKTKVKTRPAVPVVEVPDDDDSSSESSEEDDEDEEARAHVLGTIHGSIKVALSKPASGKRHKKAKMKELSKRKNQRLCNRGIHGVVALVEAGKESRAAKEGAAANEPAAARQQGDRPAKRK